MNEEVIEINGKKYVSFELFEELQSHFNRVCDSFDTGRQMYKELLVRYKLQHSIIQANQLRESIFETSTGVI